MQAIRAAAAAAARFLDEDVMATRRTLRQPTGTFLSVNNIEVVYTPSFSC